MWYCRYSHLSIWLKSTPQILTISDMILLNFSIHEFITLTWKIIHFSLVISTLLESCDIVKISPDDSQVEKENTNFRYASFNPLWKFCYVSNAPSCDTNDSNRLCLEAFGTVALNWLLCTNMAVHVIQKQVKLDVTVINHFYLLLPLTQLLFQLGNS